MNTMDVGNRIKELREEFGLSARGLADKVGLDPSQISKIEKDVSKPSLDALFRICNVLDISLSEFFDQSEVNLSHEQQLLLKHSNSLSKEQIDLLNKLLSSFTREG